MSNTVIGAFAGLWTIGADVQDITQGENTDLTFTGFISDKNQSPGKKKKVGNLKK